MKAELKVVQLFKVEASFLCVCVSVCAVSLETGENV